jgi:transcriptional regulator with XRE-family HTH domain
MGKINIGAFIAARRKEKGLTQEELADYLGVSKPAVSKWESGQSYPDILLLPVLAAFFNTSVDELLGYEAQLTKSEIRKLYERLAGAFASDPFDAVYAECREYVKKYHSCWGLLASIAQLYINHSMLAGSPEAAQEILREAYALLETVEKDCGDIRLAKQALSMRACCCLMLGEPSEAIDLLDEEDDRQMTPELLLAKAYAMKGDVVRARELLQRFVYISSSSIIAAITDLMALYADEPARIEACLALVLEFGDALDLKKTLPHPYFTLYLTAAALFAAGNNTARALDMLEAYTALVTDPDIYPLKLRGNSFFDLIEPYFESQNLGNSAPRSEKLIKKDMKDVVINNPAFFGLVSEERYRRLVSRLEHFE